MSIVKVYNHSLWDHGISQGYSVNGTIYISGQFSHDSNGAFVGEGNIELQTKQTLKNIEQVLSSFNVTKENLAYVEVYLTNAPEHGEKVINLFKEFVGAHRPAGSLIGVQHLAFPQQWIEISAIAHAD